jgi:hypothetical protein
LQRPRFYLLLWLVLVLMLTSFHHPKSKSIVWQAVF